MAIFGCVACGIPMPLARHATEICKICVPDKSSLTRYRRYGITRPEFDSMLIEQDNRCLLCNQPFGSAYDICIDHCHKTGRVRGLLDRGCNMVLSRFEDAEYVARVSAYLELGGDLPHAEAEDLSRVQE